MKTIPFANLNADKRFATTAEYNNGYPCGPADQNLFNGQWYRLESEIGHVIEYAGLIGVDTDLTQLRQAIQQLILSGIAGLGSTGGGTVPTIDTSQFILIGQARVRLPIFPEIFTADWKMGVTSPSTGTVRVPAGVSFQHRGIFPIVTVQTDFPTVLSKTYHLRWNPTDGFVLKDLADTGYNPTVAAETSDIFDSDYDDMLVARVVTNASNIATITNLVNADRLMTEILSAGAMNSPATNDANRTQAFSWNWARKPQMSFYVTDSQTSPFASQNKTFSGSSTHDHDWHVEQTVPLSRYGMTLLMKRDWSMNFDVAVQIRA